jgi:hypothetical protein
MLFCHHHLFHDSAQADAVAENVIFIAWTESLQ